LEAGKAAGVVLQDFGRTGKAAAEFALWGRRDGRDGHARWGGRGGGFARHGTSVRMTDAADGGILFGDARTGFLFGSGAQQEEHALAAGKAVGGRAPDGIRTRLATTVRRRLVVTFVWVTGGAARERITLGHVGAGLVLRRPGGELAVQARLTGLSVGVKGQDGSRTVVAPAGLGRSRPCGCCQEEDQKIRPEDATRLGTHKNLHGALTIDNTRQSTSV
jgi:hypothetical protein